MRFSCGKEDFVFGVKTVSKALGSSSNMPILSGIKMEIEGNLLKLTACDLEKSIRCSIPLKEVEETGSPLVLDGNVLAKIISRLPEAKVELAKTEDRNMMELSCKGAIFDLFLLPVEDYPEIPTLPEKPICRINSKKLKRGLDQTTFAALTARETARLNLTGVDLLFESDKFKMVATNGYRLALAEIIEKTSLEGEYLISADALRSLNQILTPEESPVEIYHEDGQMFFKFKDIIFTVKQIEEEYPDFNRVIPTESRIGLNVKRKSLLSALERAEIVASEESGAVILEASDGSYELVITSSSPERGEAEETCALEKPAKEITISFRASYLIEALKKMYSSLVTFWLTDQDSAGLLEPSGDSEEDNGFIYVCMPIKMD